MIVKLILQKDWTPIMSRLEIIQVVASVLGALGVIAGAFGSHALKTKLEAREATKTWDTAVKYHFIHTLALVHVGTSWH